MSNIQCTIERHNSGMNKLFPKYVLKESNSNKILMRAEKIANSTTPHYKITIDKPGINQTDEKGMDYVGRLRANFKSNQFYIFDTGVHPQDYDPTKTNDPRNKVRRQYGTVRYLDKGSGMSDTVSMTSANKKGPRKFEFYIPKIADDGNESSSWADNMKRKTKVNIEYAQ